MENKKILLDRLIQAVIDNNVKLVGELLNHGADPNLTLDTDHVTPLHYAAQSNALEVIPLLVEAGAALEAQTEPDGYTPIEIAFIHGHHRIAQALIAYANETDARQH